jgi:hypothetical protein
MSSSYVRNLVRGRAAGFPRAKFYDTVNFAQDPQDPLWATIEFVAADNEWMTYCSTQESGIFNVVFFGQAGVGDGTMLVYAEQDMAYLMALMDSRLTLLKNTPPDDYERSDGTPGFVVSFTVNYVCN